MGKIVIDRESNYLGCVANYDVFLDNIKIDSISNGVVKEYIIPNGKHSLYLQNGLISFGLKSNILYFDLENEDVIKILCKSGLYSLSGITLEFDKSQFTNKFHGNSINNKYDLLEKLSKLKEINAITDEEFEREKRKILGGDK